MINLQATAEDIVGSWRAPETEGVELGYYFYPDGELILQNPRHKQFTMRGTWRLESGSRLVISDVIPPDETLPEAEREFMRSERHNISIMKITRDSMVWQPEEAPEEIEFRREGDLPEREEKFFWRKFFGV